MKNLKIFFMLFIIISISGINLFSQDKPQGLLDLKIKVLKSKGIKIENVIFKVFENDKEIKTVEGGDIIPLDLDKTYIIEVAYNKSVKYMTVITKVPDKFKSKYFHSTCRYKLYDFPDSYDKPSSRITLELRKFKLRSVMWGGTLEPDKKHKPSDWK